MLIVFTLISIVIGSNETEPNRFVAGYARPSGRMMEVYSDKFLAGLAEDERSKLIQQAETDVLNDQYTPMIDSTLMESTPFGTIQLGKRIHQGKSTILFSVNEYSNLIIKYQAHCRDIQSEIHPLLKDAWYMNETNGFGIAPRVHFISPASDLCEFQKDKCGFSMGGDQWNQCESERGALRYMIMERSDGLSLHAYRREFFRETSGRMKFVDSMVIGVRLIQLLKKLHMEARIVHGDIHTPNVMINFTNIYTGEFSLSLIDFGTASRYVDSPLPTKPIRRAYHFYHHLFTQWQMDGFAWAARDDLLKAIQTVAQLMHPFSYIDFEQEQRDSGYRVLCRWKLECNWFITWRDPVKSLPISRSAKSRIHELLLEILAIGRGMSINGPLPYRELELAMIECIRLARGYIPAATSERIVSTNAPAVLPNSTLGN